VTPTRRSSSRPHTARLRYGRHELAGEEVWEELQQHGAAAAIVRFYGGGGQPGSLGATTLETSDRHELTRWSTGEGVLVDALAAPIWCRYARFRGHPRITGMVLWDVANHEVLVVSKRADHEFTEVLLPRPPPAPRHASDPAAVSPNTPTAGAEQHEAGVRAVRGPGRARGPARSALLLQTLPAGRFSSTAARAERPRWTHCPGTLRLVRRSHARRDQTRSALLLQTLPAGCLPGAVLPRDHPDHAVTTRRATRR
jgi:hypothetical protein